MYSVCICAIIKNERFEYLREWLLYHALVGVDHFFLYDNESDCSVAEDVERMGLGPMVDVVDWPGTKVQLAAYGHCLQNRGGSTTWMAFVDLDEFIVPNRHDSLQLLLSDYMDHAGLALNWAYFTTNGHDARPEGLQVENYTRRYLQDHRVNRHIKTIARPEFVHGGSTPHDFIFAPGTHCVNTDHHPVVGPYFPACWDVAQVNHYIFRSREDYLDKLARGRAHTVERPLQVELLDVQAATPSEEDDSVLRFVPRLKLMVRQEAPDMVLDMVRARLGKKPEQYLAEAAREMDRGRVDRAMDVIRVAEVYHPESMEVKVAGIHLARMRGDGELAERLLNRGLRTGARPEMCREMMLDFSAGGAEQNARACATYIKDYLELRGMGDLVAEYMRRP
jgi:hypothetical protein